MNGKTGFLSQAALLTGIIAAVFAIILPIYSKDSPVPSQIQANSDQLDEFSQRFSQRIRSDKICAETNPAACSALFRRLNANITPRQRLVLACTVGRDLNLDVPKRCKPIPRGPNDH